MLKALRDQIDDIRKGLTKNIPTEYGHAIGVIAQMGQEEYLLKGTKKDQIEAMRKKAEQEVIKYGLKILDHLRPELRALIQPEDLEGLEQKHQMYLTSREKER